MDPVNKKMRPYSYQKDHMHYGPHYYPGADSVPPQMFVNPARPPMNYEYWPWGSNYGCGYGHPSPMVCHGCCNHSYLPNHYAWRPPCSHTPPAHYQGNYLFSPVQYMPPPAGYAVEHPRYEYEKNASRDHHCCGCPNHQSHHKEQKNVRIEDEERDSVVPFQFKNNKPYPILWLPHDYNTNKEQGKPHNLEDRRDGSLKAKPQEHRSTVEGPPALGNGWYPIDLRNFISSKQDGDGDRNHQQDEDKGHFPFPLFWMPYKPDGKEREEEHIVRDGNAKPNLDWKKVSGGERNLNKDAENDVRQAASRAKDIPVKEVKQDREKEVLKTKEKERGASSKDGIDGGENKTENGEMVSRDGAKRKSSPPKSAKLPPVCLRVDPLPRKKGANGSSRSPSPPGDKQKVDQQSNEASKVVTSSENKKRDVTSNNGLKEGKGITKTIDVVETSQERSIDVKKETPVNPPVLANNDVSKNQAEEQPKEETISQKYAKTDEAVKEDKSEDAGSARGKNEESFRSKEVSDDEAKRNCEKKLSEEEAAVIIQSAYRGFDIRSWEPIKKLKQIAQVREEIAEVKHLIQVMESSSDIQGKIKQRNIIAEIIMSLLLKLDTIQGLHARTRDIRKAVVRELVSLQEKLDSLINEKSEASPANEPIECHVKDPHDKTEVAVSTQDDNVTPSDLSDADQNQLDGGSDNENSEILVATLIGEQPSKESDKNGTAESCATEYPRSASEDSAETTKNSDERSNTVDENGELEDLVQKNTSVEEIDYEPNQDDVESGLAELPLGVLDDLCEQENSSLEMGEERSIEADITSEFNGGDADKENNEHVELNELPFSGVDVIAEEVVDSKMEPDECAAQQQENIITEVLEPPYEASDEREIPITEAACSKKDSTCNILHEECEVNDAENSSLSESAPDQPQEKEISEVCNENTHLETQVLNEKIKECDENILSAKENVEDGNRKLIEENERLRDMMEKLIKSGQEQLVAISSLTGRVKDLEKKLSRKKKLKTKPYRGGPKSVSLVHEAI